LEREAPSVIARSFVITSRVSPSPLSAVSLVVGVSSVSLDSSMKRLVVSSRPFLRMSFVIPSHTRSMPAGRQSRPWTLSMPSSVRERPSTVSVDKYSQNKKQGRNGPHYAQRLCKYFFPSSSQVLWRFSISMSTLKACKRRRHYFPDERVNDSPSKRPSPHLYPTRGKFVTTVTTTPTDNSSLLLVLDSVSLRS
jgi:hypothetical protein